MVLMCGVGLIVTVLPRRILLFSGSISEVGCLASAFAIPYILFQLPIGHWADRFGYKSFLIGGYALCAGAGILYAYADKPETLLVGRMVQGIGEAPLWALAPAFLSLKFPAHKGRVIGLYNASIHLGLLSGSLLGVLLLPRWGDSEAFLLFVAVSLLGGVILLCWLDEPSRVSEAHPHSGSPGRFLLFLITQRGMFSVLLGVLLYGAGYGVFLTIVPAFLFTVRDVGQTGVGTVFVIFYLTISVAQLITGPLSDRIGRTRPMVGALLLVALGMGGVAYVQFPWLNLLLGLISCGLGMLAVSSMAYLNERVPSELKGTLSGACYVFWGLGYFLCPVIAGALGQHNQYAVGFCGLAGLCALEALVVFWERRSSLAAPLTLPHQER